MGLRGPGCGPGSEKWVVNAPPAFCCPPPPCPPAPPQSLRVLRSALATLESLPAELLGRVNASGRWSGFREMLQQLDLGPGGGSGGGAEGSRQGSPLRQPSPLRQGSPTKSLGYGGGGGASGAGTPSGGGPITLGLPSPGSGAQAWAARRAAVSAVSMLGGGGGLGAFLRGGEATA